MAIRSFESLAEDRGIDLSKSTDSEVKTQDYSTSRKMKTFDELLASKDVALNTNTTTTRPQKRGLFEWLSTGEYFGVGVLKQNMDAAQRLISDPTTGGKLKAAYELIGVPGWKVIPAGLKGVKEMTELKDVISEESGAKLTPGQELGSDLGQIFLDPTLYTSLGLSKLPGLGLKYGKKIPVLGKGIEKAADAIGEKFVFQYKAPLDYAKRAAERLVRIAGGQEAAEKMAKQLTRMPGKTFGKFGRKLTLDEQRTLGDIITGQITDADPVLVQIAEPAIQTLEKLGRDAVETGLMSMDTFLKRAGEYMPRLYRKHELTDRLAKFYSARNTKIVGNRFLERGELTKAEQLAKGVIEEAAYPVAKGIRDLTFDIETAKFFKWIGQSYAKTADNLADDEIENFVKLSDTKSLGDLAGKYVPRFVADDINKLITTTPDWLKGQDTLLKLWKTGKTVLNPGYHARNFVSNFILNDIGGVNIFTPRGAKAYSDALVEMKVGGKLLTEAKEGGLLGKTFYGVDLKDFIDPLDAKSTKGLVSWVGKTARYIAKKGGDFQGFNEDFSKLAHYVYQRNAGKGVDEAIASAKRALFDYGELTQFEEKVMKRIFPFYTFSRKSIPMLMQVAVDSPGRIGKYNQLKKAIEDLSPETEEERRWLPEWQRNAFNIRLPFKDKDGNSLYWDFTYTFPYGDLLGNATRDGMSGVFRQFALMANPFLKEAAEQGLGKDFYFDKDIEMMRNQKLFGTIPTDSRLAHAIRTFAPTIYTEVADKLIPALRGKTDYAGRAIDPFQIIGNMAGFKTQKFNLDKAKTSLPYDLGEQLAPIEENLNLIKNDKSITEEQRQSEFEYWNKKKQELLDQYPGVMPKRRLWIDGSREIKKLDVKESEKPTSGPRTPLPKGSTVNQETDQKKLENNKKTLVEIYKNIFTKEIPEKWSAFLSAPGKVMTAGIGLAAPVILTPAIYATFRKQGMSQEQAAIATIQTINDDQAINVGNAYAGDLVKEPVQQLAKSDAPIAAKALGIGALKTAELFSQIPAYQAIAALDWSSILGKGKDAPLDDKLLNSYKQQLNMQLEQARHKPEVAKLINEQLKSVKSINTLADETRAIIPKEQLTPDVEDAITNWANSYKMIYESLQSGVVDQSLLKEFANIHPETFVPFINKIKK